MKCSLLSLPELDQNRISYSTNNISHSFKLITNDILLYSTFACATDCSVSDKDRTLAKLYQAPYDLMTQGFLAEVRETCKSEGTYVLTLLLRICMYTLSYLDY